jgi:hypothetical protein
MALSVIADRSMMVLCNSEWPALARVRQVKACGEHEPLAASPAERAGAVVVGCPPMTGVTAMTAAGGKPSLGAVFPEPIVEHFAQRRDNRRACGSHVIGDLMQAARN